MPDDQDPPQTKKQRTAEEVEAKLNQVKLRTAEIQLQRAEMELEQTEETIKQFKADKEARSRRNQQRQGQLRIDISEKAGTARKCTHRQGGSLSNPYGGKGPSALQLVILPDERELIMCSICPLRVFSPFPGDASRRLRRGETREQADARVEKHMRQVEAFETLRAESNNKLTEEAAGAMHCGKTFKFLDGDSNQVQVTAPCDHYAQGLDNRDGVRS
jgi:hypothetical protein